MYLEFFGLRNEPFRITPDIDFFFQGGNRGAILDALIYAIQHGEGVIKITGEVGSGKTLLCRMLEERLPESVTVIYFANPSLPASELVPAIAGDLQIAADPHSDQPLLQRVQYHLIREFEAGRRVVLFVEEAQAMPLATLEQIRLLSNLETRRDKLLQIVLFGQPELDQLLKDHQIRPLRERITHSFALEPLSPGDTYRYLNWRMDIAGYRGAELFDRAIVRRMPPFTRGLIRRINILADKVLLAAFADQTRNIGARQLLAAARDCEFGKPVLARRRTGYALLMLLFCVIAGALALYIAQRGFAPAASNPKALDKVVANAPQPAAAPRQPPPAALAPPAAAGVSSETASGVSAQAPPPVPAARPQIAAVTDPSLLDQRMAITREWLQTADRTGYSVQIMTIDGKNVGNLERFLLKLQATDAATLDKLHVFPTSNQGWLNVTHGFYRDRTQARQQMQLLATQLNVKRPFLRSVRGMQESAGLLPAQGQQP